VPQNDSADQQPELSLNAFEGAFRRGV
jgi:hypothetical protein